ncbi:metalloprotease [Coprinopsis cinerea okayama7|uniref:Metalloprotease n=1 Tax=Coprinopsis cinerea (strain Okayama-7 / 130 / ATCC MYA-4618 / FGSC 9003) TaxID=240176 RepID=A8NKS3_COPC7|nr:metalloprotease [Coprinopsis cinerea okayama7\|eukprot:XP_001834533.2 metalloprotease [Coprinopsis cinerea okayama7\
MFFKSYLAFATIVATSTQIFTNALTVSERCGSTIDDATKAQMEAAFLAHRVPPPPSTASSLSTARARPINLFWHVISSDETPEGGNIPDSAIQTQMDVLNTAFEGTGMQFTLVNVSRTVHPTWFAGAFRRNELNYEMKATLRKGGAADLNVWSTGFTELSGLLGYATFPANITTEPENDGVAIKYTTLPGGNQVYFNLGHTLTHEVGHWAGLFHVFEGFSCEGDGDFVDDTPPQSTPTDGCPLSPWKNSCGRGEPGDLPDSYRNYMDYSYDRCMCEFTNGQVERMHDQLGTYRGIELRTGRLLVPRATSDSSRLQARQMASRCVEVLP